MSDLVPLERHRARVLAAVQQLPETRLPLAEALGCVLAQPVAAVTAIPGFDNSAMDGYAVRHEDVAEPGSVLRLVADVAAGSALDPRLRRGEAARIMTGAPVPSDADAIVPLEDTDLGIAIGRAAPSRITVLVPPRAGAHIRRAGEDAVAGTEIVPAGTVLGPLQLTAAASAGHPDLSVVRRAQVAVISTGSELVPPGTIPRRGEVVESNSVLLAAAVREAGAEVTAILTVDDDDDALRAALQAACLDADAVILSGGVSVGAFDVVKAVLSTTGTVDFTRIAMQPGKPQGFGTASDGTLLFCLPGNPVSVAVSFEMFVRPALKTAMGHRDIDRARVMRTAGTGWRTPAGRTQVMPAVADDEIVWPASAGGSGSHLVGSLAAANAFAVVPAAIDRIEPGDPVAVMLLT